MEDVERADARARAAVQQGGSLADSASSANWYYSMTVILVVIALCAVAPYLRSFSCGPTGPEPVRYVFVKDQNSVGTSTQQFAASNGQCPPCPSALAGQSGAAGCPPAVAGAGGEESRVVSEHHSIFPALPPEFWLLYHRYNKIQPQHTVLDQILTHGEKPVCPTDPFSLVIEFFQYSEEVMQRMSGKEMAKHEFANPDADKHLSPHMFYGRNAELLAVLQMNVLHPAISNVHVHTETQAESDLVQRKIYDPCGKVITKVVPSSWEEADGRISNNRSFSNILQYIDSTLPKGSLFVLTHSDIVLGEDVDHFLDAPKRDPPIDFAQGHLVMLSRWGIDVPECHQLRDGRIEMEDQCVKYQGSHDTIVARTPIKQQLIDTTKFSRSQLGSENKFLFWADRAGYKLHNPCGNVKTYHSHCSSLRIDHNYGVRINGGGESVTVGGSGLQ